MGDYIDLADRLDRYGGGPVVREAAAALREADDTVQMLGEALKACQECADSMRAENGRLREMFSARQD